MRNIIKIEINKKEKKAIIYDKNKSINIVTFSNDLSGYIILRAFKCSDMLNLDNCNEIKLNINNISYDFISHIGILNFNIK